MLTKLRNRQRGFTLIELLIVVAIIGIIAAILIPNLIDALQKAKQKRTVADMRNVGTAFMSWVTDAASAGAAGAATFAASNYTDLSYASLQTTLNPGSGTFFYMENPPQNDGWKHAYVFGFNADGNILASNVFAIVSGGNDGDVTSINDVDGVSAGPFTPTDYPQNIIWADGFFVRWPGST